MCLSGTRLPVVVIVSGIKKGRCACGKVAFEARLPQVKSVICHCHACQMRTGSAFGLMVYFRDEDVSFSSAHLRIYAYQADSGNDMQSRFCVNCGTSLFLIGDLNTGLIGIAGGCFDEERFFYEVDREIFCRSKAPFVENDVKLSIDTSPRYGQMKQQQ